MKKNPVYVDADVGLAYPPPCLDDTHSLWPSRCIARSLSPHVALDHWPAPHGVDAMAAPFMTLHVATHAKGLATSRVRALVRLLARVGMAVDPQAAGPAEGLVARRAQILVLALRVDAAL